MRWGNITAFASEHPLVSRLIQLSASHPPVSFKEDDLEFLQLETQKSATAAAAPAVVRAKASEPHEPCLSSVTVKTGRSKRQEVHKTPCSAKSADIPRDFHRERKSASDAGSFLPLPASGALSAAEIGAHGDLYDYISFTNVPQWVAICTLVLSAYRVASQASDRRAQEQAVEDILMLPQRVLTRTSRGGDPRRLTSTIRARCKGVEWRMRERGISTHDHCVTLGVSIESLLHRSEPETCDSTVFDNVTELQQESGVGHTAKGTGHSTLLSASSTASTVLQPGVDDEDDRTSGERQEEAATTDDDYVRPFLSSLAASGDPDQQAAKRAQHHVRKGHLRKAAQVLYSTATMADLTQPEVQAAVRVLHPPLPAGSDVPFLPADSPHMILEDDDVMAQLLRRSDNGSASGPSGWGGNMVSSLAESDVCRAGIIALLKDIVNGNLPERARQLLLACRAVALNKPTGGYRPIAVGELF